MKVIASISTVLPSEEPASSQPGNKAHTDEDYSGVEFVAKDKNAAQELVRDVRYMANQANGTGFINSGLATNFGTASDKNHARTFNSILAKKTFLALENQGVRLRNHNVDQKTAVSYLKTFLPKQHATAVAHQTFANLKHGKTTNGLALIDTAITMSANKKLPKLKAGDKVFADLPFGAKSAQIPKASNKLRFGIS